MVTRLVFQVIISNYFFFNSKITGINSNHTILIHYKLIINNNNKLDIISNNNEIFSASAFQMKLNFKFFEWKICAGDCHGVRWITLAT